MQPFEESLAALQDSYITAYESADAAGLAARLDEVQAGLGHRKVIGDAATPHEAFFYHGGNQLKAVRSGNWKLHTNQGKPTQLYNLETDIGETTNLIAKHPEIAEELRSLYASWDAQMPGPLSSAGKPRRSKNKNKSANK